MIGRLRDIYIFTDEREIIKETLSQILEEEILTPQPERLFRLRYKSLSQISNFPQFHTILLIGTLSDTIIRQFLGKNQEIVERDTFAFFVIKPEKKKREAKSQFFIFVARDKGLLNRGLVKYRERIKHSFENHLSELIYKLTYSRGGDEKLERRLERYGFRLEVPKGFLLKEEYAPNNFIYLFTHYPDRSIFIYWSAGEKRLSPNELITLRDSLTYLYYGGDYVERQYTRYSETKFLGNPAIKLQGIWQNDQAGIGGPFVAYAFNDRGRFYFIDGTLYNPGKRKLNNLLQLSVILSTFYPE